MMVIKMKKMSIIQIIFSVINITTIRQGTSFQLCDHGNENGIFLKNKPLKKWLITTCGNHVMMIVKIYNDFITEQISYLFSKYNMSKNCTAHPEYLGT